MVILHKAAQMYCNTYWKGNHLAAVVYGLFSGLFTSLYLKNQVLDNQMCFAKYVYKAVY